MNRQWAPLNLFKLTNTCSLISKWTPSSQTPASLQPSVDCRPHMKYDFMSQLVLTGRRFSHFVDISLRLLLQNNFYSFIHLFFVATFPSLQTQVIQFAVRNSEHGLHRDQLRHTAPSDGLHWQQQVWLQHCCKAMWVTFERVSLHGCIYLFFFIVDEWSIMF